MALTTLQCLWHHRAIDPDFRCGVSLHSHTMYSEENLEMIPRYTSKVPFLGRAVRDQSDRYERLNRHPLDFSKAFWTPPLSPQQAHRLEQEQIEKVLQLPGFVSLTDHDDMRAGVSLQAADRIPDVPISLEWTIPFGPTFFHLGVHNLPASSADGILAGLRAYTANPTEPGLHPLLHELNRLHDVLLVLNHPLWDEKGIGSLEHATALDALLRQYGHYFHALELNGLRSFRENRRVLKLAEHVHLPAISGGDRHGLEPNAIVNLSRGRSLLEFIHEIRHRRRSHVVLLPQYREPIRMRVLQTMVDVVRNYAENPKGRQLWSDRVFFRRAADTSPLPLSACWRSEPAIVSLFIKAMRLAEFRGVRSALRLAFEDRQVWIDQEATV